MSTPERINDPNFDSNHLYVLTGDGLQRKDLRSEINQAITANRLSVHRLAKEIGFDCHNLATYLRGKRGIPVDVLERIFARLKM